MFTNWLKRLTQRRFFVLLISLLLLPLVYPLLSSLGFVGTRILSNIFFSVMLFSCVYAISDNKRLFTIALILGIPAFGARWVVGFLGSSPGVMVAMHIVVVLFLLVVTATMLSHVLKDEVVTGEKVSAAICVYLFIGLIWAYLFSLTHYLQPGSFLIEDPDLSHFIYYSFITLSTLGYGDITPLSPPARALSYTEAITGQLYLTVLVARLVGLHIAHHKKG
ncbi:MAG: two pore domain potassium channel family protein [Deltaproteobacteria bacterium]|nr:two pore domain potassium channel family protein [Deltaproteobacteria bacterium]